MQKRLQIFLLARRKLGYIIVEYSKQFTQGGPLNFLSAFAADASSNMPISFQSSFYNFRVRSDGLPPPSYLLARYVWAATPHFFPSLVDNACSTISKVYRVSS